jgi:hypothetical protein
MEGREGTRWGRTKGSAVIAAECCLPVRSRAWPLRRHPARPAKADGYSCSGRNVVDVYRNAGFNDSNPGATGYTGVGRWLNYVDAYDNKTSSFWNEGGYVARWHDYANGQGAYYGNGFECRYVQDLTPANMGDGGTANDRFSSVAMW